MYKNFPLQKQYLEPFVLSKAEEYIEGHLDKLKSQYFTIKKLIVWIAKTDPEFQNLCIAPDLVSRNAKRIISKILKSFGFQTIGKPKRKGYSVYYYPS